MKNARTDTVKVNICYRPLRICWAITEGDHAAFRTAVALSNTTWGGRYNPIVIADRANEAASIVEVFRADIVVPVGASQSVAAFQQRFAHLISPFFPDTLFVGNNDEDARAHLLDVYNALIYLSDSPAQKAFNDKGWRLYTWDDDDPLKDILLMQLGAYPDVAQTRVKYRELVVRATNASEHLIAKATALPKDLFEHPSIAYLSRHGLSRHYGIQSNWDYPGFYLGDCTSLDDLVNCWNLRALDTPLLFVDRNHLDRYEHVIPAWSKITNETVSRRRLEHQRNMAIWTQRHQMPTTQDGHNAFVTQLKQIFAPTTWPTISLLTSGRKILSYKG